MSYLNNKQFNWLKKALLDWESQALISSEQKQNILNLYQLEESKSSWIISLLASAFVGLGIILIVAHNWNFISPAIRLTIAFSIIILSQIYLYFAQEKIHQEISATLLALTLGAGLAIFSQVFQTQGGVDDFIRNWLYFLLPLVIISRSVGASIVAQVLLFIFILNLNHLSVSDGLFILLSIGILFLFNCQNTFTIIPIIYLFGVKIIDDFLYHELELQAFLALSSLFTLLYPLHKRFNWGKVSYFYGLLAIFGLLSSILILASFGELKVFPEYHSTYWFYGLMIVFLLAHCYILKINRALILSALPCFLLLIHERIEAEIITFFILATMCYLLYEALQEQRLLKINVSAVMIGLTVFMLFVKERDIILGGIVLIAFGIILLILNLNVLKHKKEGVSP